MQFRFYSIDPYSLVHSFILSISVVEVTATNSHIHCHWHTHYRLYINIIFYVLQKIMLKKVHASTLACSALFAPHLCRPIQLNLLKNFKLTLHSVHFFFLSRSVYWSITRCNINGRTTLHILCHC